MRNIYIYVAIFIIFGVGYQIFMYMYANRRKKELLEWLEKNPKAAKVYIGKTSSLLGSIFTPSSIRLIAIDDNYPMTSFAEGFKQGFYLTPGNHRITSSFEKTRPGFFSKTVTTQYAPSTQEVEVEAEKTYIYSFDKKNEQYTLTEKN